MLRVALTLIRPTRCRFVSNSSQGRWHAYRAAQDPGSGGEAGQGSGGLHGTHEPSEHQLGAGQRCSDKGTFGLLGGGGEGHACYDPGPEHAPQAHQQHPAAQEVDEARRWTCLSFVL